MWIWQLFWGQVIREFGLTLYKEEIIILLQKCTNVVMILLCDMIVMASYINVRKTGYTNTANISLILNPYCKYVK